MHARLGPCGRTNAMRVWRGAARRHVAAAEGAYSVVQWLVQEEGVDINCIDRHNRTPLEVRARRPATAWPPGHHAACRAVVVVCGRRAASYSAREDDPATHPNT